MNRRSFIKKSAFALSASGLLLPRDGYGQITFPVEGWTPRKLPSLVSIYDPKDITGKVDGNTVTTWNDSWGAHTLTAATVIPVYKTNIINGNPVVRFISTSHGYTTSAFAFPGNKLSFICVFQTTASATSQILAETSANYNVNNAAFICDYSDITTNTLMLGVNDTTGINYCHTTNTLAANTWGLMVGTADKSNATHVAQCYKFGVEASPVYQDVAAATGNWASYLLSVGSRNGSTTSVLRGDIGYMAFTSAVINPVDLLNIQKWARLRFLIGS